MNPTAAASTEVAQPKVPDGAKVAYSIDELVAAGPLSRSYLYEEIRVGRLKVRKAGRRTLVLRDEWLRYLNELPLGAAAAA